MQSQNKPQGKLTRRGFFKTAALGTVIAGAGRSIGSAAETDSAERRRVPLKIGIRAASVQMVGDLGVVRTAASIPGLLGVELQATGGKQNLRDWDVVRQYKKEANRWGIRIPSLAGVWDRGVQIHSPAAHDSLLKSIRAAELLGSSVILLAFFKENAPDMTREESFGPVVSLLQKTAPPAADAGVILGLENSLSPSDNKKLVDLVAHPAVGVYYDLHNMAFYGHGDQAIPGVKLLGRERICMVHVKNGSMLLEEPGPIDWVAAFREFNEIQYDGWYVYETGHDSTADCIEDTKKNNAFLQKHVQMPMA
jgi:sugar phosphate isomerase/epimerase